MKSVPDFSVSAETGCMVMRAQNALAPVVLSSPHSGNHYPDGLLERMRVSPTQLRSLQDGPIDRLIAPARFEGADSVCAVYPRAVVDLNRRPDEFETNELHGADDRMLFSSNKSRVGLGVIPTRVMGAPIYHQPISRCEFDDRLERAYWPYYTALDSVLSKRVQLFDHVLLMDCHSMPDSIARNGNEIIDVNFGDRFGKTCRWPLMNWACEFMSKAGLRVSRNRPFAGGRIVEHFGQPTMGISALQIEFRRGLFMDEQSHEANDRFDGLADIMQGLVSMFTKRLAAEQIDNAA